MNMIYHTLNDAARQAPHVTIDAPRSPSPAPDPAHRAQFQKREPDRGTER
jgi:hypothetical protein